MGPPHDDYNDNAERITLHESTPDSRQYEQDTEQVHEPSAAQPVVEGGNDVDDGDVRVSMATDDDNNDNRQETTTPEEAPLLSRSYSQDSVVSTDSAPPPYQFYPPAKTFFGRAYNWLRHIPRLRSHQAIALPTLPIRRPRYTRMDSLSSASIDSFASSAYPATCCSYAYYSIASRCPTLPRVVLPSFLARFRGLMICLSIFALLIFSILLFCAVLFAPASVTPGPFPDKSTDSTARMLTANIFMRPPGVTNNWSDFKDERLDYIVKYVLPDYDIVAFQEVFGFASRRKDRLIQQARNMGYNYHVESPRHYPWEFAADGGLLILSRFPILASNTIEYPRGIHSDWLSRKGALHALIQLNSTRYMHLYTTHAQASYTGTAEPSQTDVQVRMAQFSLLHQFIRDTAQNDNIPIVLMGDFNVDAAVHQGHPQTEPSKESSREYKMMMDVLNGRGVDVSSFYKMEKEVDDGQQVDNIDGGNGGTNVKYMTRRLYEDPQYSLVLADAVYETYHYHPVTYGDVVMGEDGQLEPAETVLTDQDQAMSVQSIDRIFWDKSRSAETLQVKDAQVEKFLVRNNDQLTKEEKEMIPFTQISGKEEELNDV